MIQLLAQLITTGVVLLGLALAWGVAKTPARAVGPVLLTVVALWATLQAVWLR